MMNMKKTVFFTLLLIIFNQGVNAQNNYLLEQDPIDYVNILMGTDSKHSLSAGNTYPAIARPWGMNFWTPQTGKMGDGWQYTYAADKIREIGRASCRERV